jgi:hypothetical protein
VFVCLDHEVHGIAVVGKRLTPTAVRTPSRSRRRAPTPRS